MTSDEAIFKDPSGGHYFAYLVARAKDADEDRLVRLIRDGLAEFWDDTARVVGRTVATADYLVTVRPISESEHTPPIAAQLRATKRALAAAEDRVRLLESLIRRLDWENIHTHYGYSSCEDCGVVEGLET